MLKIENLTFTYPGANDPVLKDLSLEIKKGTFLAVVGSNGSGKTTMCKLFNGIIPHFFVGDFTGKVTVDGIDTLESDVSLLSEKVGYVYQDFESSIVRATVFEEVSFAPLNYGFDDFEERALRALEILEISHLKDQHIWMLSGGQKHMVALASCLSIDPDYIIVDEPVAQLDPYNARNIYDMLKKLHEEYDKTIIVIEHHTEFIADYCKEVVLMKDGRLKWIKPVQEALTDTKTLRECNILPPQVTQLAEKLELTDQDAYPINLDQAYEYFKDCDFADIDLDDNQDFLNNPTTVKIENLTASYKDYNKNTKDVLKDINLEIKSGEKLAIIGNNGAGKSTLMKNISKLMQPTKGKIEIMGNDIANISSEKLSDTVSYIYQNPEEMFIDDSVQSDVAFFLKARNVEGYEDTVAFILETMNLNQFADHDARLLSGGQQRRVSLAIGMGMTPKIIMLDEPTGSLDISSRRELLKLLEILKVHIETPIVATHDMQLVADWATRVIVLNQGQIIGNGSPREIFQAQEIMEISHLIPPQIVCLCYRLNLDHISLSVDEMAERYWLANNKKDN